MPNRRQSVLWGIISGGLWVCDVAALCLGRRLGALTGVQAPGAVIVLTGAAMTASRKLIQVPESPHGITARVRGVEGRLGALSRGLAAVCEYADLSVPGRGARLTVVPERDAPDGTG